MPMPDQGSIPAEPVPSETPTTVDGGLNKASIIGFVMQMLIALGAIISFMGLAETSWIVRTYRFLVSEQAVPVISLAATAVLTIVSWVRTRRRTGKLAFFGALLPNRIVRVSGSLHPSVQAAVDQATDGGRVVFRAK